MTRYHSVEHVNDIALRVARYRPQIATIVRSLNEPIASPFNPSALDPLRSLLADAGYQFERPSTNRFWRATIGGGEGARLLFCLETHPEPELGHIAGRPLAAAAITTALAVLAPLIKHAGGSITVIGPIQPDEPAPDLGANMFDSGEVDAALHVQIGAAPSGVAQASQAGQLIELRFVGKASHAAAAPERGVNALEGVIQTIGLVNALRQHLRSEIRINGIIGVGGAAVNIVPDRAVLQYWIRTPGPVSLERTVQRITACAQAAATAAGATVELERIGDPVQNLMPNQALALAGQPYWSPLWDGTNSDSSVAPTGFGAISQRVPAILALYSVPNAPAQTIGLASRLLDPAVLAVTEQAAIALVQTAYDFLVQPDVLSAAKIEHEHRLSRMRDFARQTPTQG